MGAAEKHLELPVSGNCTERGDCAREGLVVCRCLWVDGTWEGIFFLRKGGWNRSEVMVMLTLVEVAHDVMGLSRGGFQPGRDLNPYGRESYGAADGNVGLQQSLNDFIQSTLLQQQEVGLEQCGASQHVDTAGLMSGELYGACAPSMGFSLPSMDMDRGMGLFEDVLPQVVGHEKHYNVPVSVVSSMPYGTTPSVRLGRTHVDVAPVGLQSQIVRERWVEAPLTTQRPLKQETGLCHTELKLRKVIDKSSRTMDVKQKRPPEQSDHILRERQRRDDMTSKFAILESLLPIGVKRDRSTIVEDSIAHLKNLHHRIEELQGRRSDLQRATTVKLDRKRARVHPEGAAEVLQPYEGGPSKSRETPAAAQIPSISQDEMRNIHDLLGNCLEKMEVHADRPRQVVIEMVCKPRPRLQSVILQCLEALKLDVMHCSITKVAQRLIVVIIAKPVEVTVSTSGIVAALKYALGSGETTP